MKKNLHFAFMALIVAITAASCKPQPVITYPESIIGFWEAPSGETNKWYGLDIVDATNASFITYYSQDDPVEQAMSISYDATTGKGRLSGDGKMIQLRATTDSTLALTLVEGTVVFYRGVRPKPTINMTGLWKSNRIDDMGLDILVYPIDSKGTTNVTVIKVDEMFSEYVGTMGTLTSFNQETGSGFITSEHYTGKFNVITGNNPLTLTLVDSDEMYVLTKQPKKTNTPTSLVGTWTTSLPGTLSITIVVASDNTCTIDYSVIDPETLTTKEGIAKGTIYYCPVAGMGAVVPHDLDKHPELVELIGADACGVFNTTSENTVSVSFMGINLIFQKK